MNVALDYCATDFFRSRCVSDNLFHIYIGLANSPLPRKARSMLFRYRWRCGRPLSIYISHVLGGIIDLYLHTEAVLRLDREPAWMPWHGHPSCGHSCKSSKEPSCVVKLRSKVTKSMQTIPATWRGGRMGQEATSSRWVTWPCFGRNPPCRLSIFVLSNIIHFMNGRHIASIIACWAVCWRWARDVHKVKNLYSGKCCQLRSLVRMPVCNHDVI